jgi:hypothetical protein
VFPGVRPAFAGGYREKQRAGCRGTPSTSLVGGVVAHRVLVGQQVEVGEGALDVGVG